MRKTRVAKCIVLCVLVATLAIAPGASQASSGGNAKGAVVPSAQATTTAIPASLRVTVKCSTCTQSVPLTWGDGTTILVPPGTLNKLYEHLYKYSGLYKAAIAGATAAIGVAAAKPGDNPFRMRVQLQEGTLDDRTHSKNVLSPRPILKVQVQAALQELFYTTKTEAKWFPWTQGQVPFFSAVIRTSEWIEKVAGCINTTGHIHTENFSASGRSFHLDLVNDVGCNLVNP